MLTGLSYAKALKLLHPKRKPGAKIRCTWVSEDILNKCLKHLGFKVKWMRARETYPSDALLFIEHPIYRGTMGHAIVWSKDLNKHFDPYPSSQRHMKRPLSRKTYIKATVCAFTFSR